MNRNVKKAAWGILIGLPLCLAAQASTVRLNPSGNGWDLQVDGQPFYIKGVGCNTVKGSSAEQYLKMAKDMGANAVRTWGDTPPEYLDQAQHLGLKVAVGFWLNPVRVGSDSYQNKAHCRQLKESILKDVRTLKKNPAMLFWGVGTEVFSHTDNENEKKAFGAFLTDLVDAIHKEDLDHPVFYGSSDEADLPDLMQYVSNVDLIGIDTYGALNSVMGWMGHHSVNKPMFLSEFGPHGAWDVPKDKNGEPFDPSDVIKASDYEATWHEMQAYPGRCLGGFAFVLGEPRNQDSVTWFNINDGEHPRKAYWSLYHLYTDKTPPAVPEISEFIVDSATGIPVGERFDVQAKAAITDDSRLKYDFFIAGIFSDPLIVKPPEYLPADPTTEDKSGSASLRAPKDAGVYRVYVHVSDKRGSVAIADRSIKVN